MAKIIKMTDEIKEQCRKDFQAELEKALMAARMTDGKLQFTKTFGHLDRNANVYFTELAWMKMTALLREFEKEVAWHATAYRLPGDKDEYVIKDIMVYPQTVTATTVEMDTELYAKWQMDGYLAEDERFDNIRCQMHSHVRMGVTPSPVDLTHQEEILAQLDDDAFYIFMIWNKNLVANIRIFDMQKNVLFEPTDVSWAVTDDIIGLNKFVEDAKKIVKDRVYSYQGAQGYGKSPTYTPQNYGGPYNPASQTGSAGNPNAGGNTGKGSNGNGKNGKGKGGKKDKKKTKFNANVNKSAPALTPGNNACDEGQLRIVTSGGEEFDMCDPFGYHDGPFQIT